MGREAIALTGLKRSKYCTADLLLFGKGWLTVRICIKMMEVGRNTMLRGEQVR